MKKFLKYAVALMAVAMVSQSFVSCSKDEDEKEEVKSYELTLTVTLPEGMNASDAKNLKAVVTKGEFSKETTIDNSLTTKISGLAQGSYSISVTGSVAEETGAILQGTGNVDVYDNATATVALAKIYKSPLLFKSIYTTGGKAGYTQDGYFEIVNNSDEVQYLDQLILFYCSGGQKTANAWQAIGITDIYYMGQTQVWAFPGNGTDYALQPGQSVLLANDATDHKTADPAGVHSDLTNADWEFYIEHATVGGGDIDYDAPNLNEIYYTNKGMRAFALGFFNGAYILAKLPEGMTPEQFVADDNNFSTTPGTVSQTRWMGMPSKYVLDAVEMWDPDETVHYSTFLPKDDAEGVLASTAWQGLCLRRKVNKITATGRVYYQDTNKSSADFLNNQPQTPGVTPTAVDE